jgi:hypothetical protein
MLGKEFEHKSLDAITRLVLKVVLPCIETMAGGPQEFSL